MRWVEINLQDVPAKTRQKIASEAKRTESSASAVVASAVAKHYGVEVDLTGTRRNSTIGKSGATVVRIPEDLRDRVRVEAATKGITMRGVVLGAVAAHLGLPAPNPAKRKRVPSRA